MSAGPGSALGEPRAGSLQIAGSAVVVGRARLGEGSILAEGAVIRSDDRGVEVGTGSAVLENSVIVGNTRIPTIIGRRSVFGHRCTVIGATVGDLCEIGNASILMPGARLGDRVFLGDAGDQGRHAHHHDLPSRHRLTLPDNQRSRPMSRAVQFSEYGTPTDVLRVVDVAAPTAGPEQVRLVVRAAGVNPVDWKILQGLMRQIVPLTLPAGLGTDVAGVVDQVGAGVTAFGVGDEVLGFSLTPAYAQLALADPASLVAKPAQVPWEVAGSLAGAGGTAWNVLEELGVTKDETLLIHAATGGVGTFAVQLAVARGARVIGTAGEQHQEQLRSLGATPVTYGPGLADRVRAIAPEGVDAVIDASGRGEIPLSIELAGGPERVLTLLAFDAADTGIRIHVDGPGANLVPALNAILGLIEDGRLQVPIERTYPLTEAAAALDASQTGHVSGKLVLVP